MFALNTHQDRVYKILDNLPVFGSKIFSFWLKHGRSGVKGMDLTLSLLETNRCEARLSFPNKLENGETSCQLSRLCEWTAASCYSYTHHQRLSHKLKKSTLELYKPVASEVIAIAEIHYGCLYGEESRPTTIQVEVLDIEGDQVATAEYLLTTRPITRD